MGAHIENPSSAARLNITQENLGIFKTKFETKLPTLNYSAALIAQRIPCQRAETNLYVIDADDSNQIRLTDKLAVPRKPAWSP